MVKIILPSTVMQISNVKFHDLLRCVQVSNMAHSESKEGAEGTRFQGHAWNHAATWLQVSSESGAPGALPQREQTLDFSGVIPQRSTWLLPPIG